MTTESPDQFSPPVSGPPGSSEQPPKRSDNVALFGIAIALAVLLITIFTLLRSDIKSSDERIVTLLEESSSAKTDRRHIQNQLDRLAEKVGTVDERSQGITNVSNKLGDVETRLSTLTDKVGAVDKRTQDFQAVTRDIKYVKDQLSMLTDKAGPRDELTQRFEEVTLALANLNSQLSTLTDKVGAVDNLSTQIREIRTVLGKVQASLADTQSELQPMSGSSSETTAAPRLADPPGSSIFDSSWPSFGLYHTIPADDDPDWKRKPATSGIGIRLGSPGRDPSPLTANPGSPISDTITPNVKVLP